VQADSLAIDNYSWLESLAPDSSPDDNIRHMSAVSHGRIVERTEHTAESGFGHYFDQSGLEWSTIIRNDFLTEGYVSLANAGARKCIAGQLVAGDQGGKIIFLPAPYSPDFDKSLLECINTWYNDGETQPPVVAATEVIASAPVIPATQQPIPREASPITKPASPSSSSTKVDALSMSSMPIAQSAAAVQAMSAANDTVADTALTTALNSIASPVSPSAPSAIPDAASLISSISQELSAEIRRVASPIVTDSQSQIPAARLQDAVASGISNAPAEPAPTLSKLPLETTMGSDSAEQSFDPNKGPSVSQNVSEMNSNAELKPSAVDILKELEALSMGDSPSVQQSRTKPSVRMGEPALALKRNLFDELDNAPEPEPYKQSSAISAEDLARAQKEISMLTNSEQSQQIFADTRDLNAQLNQMAESLVAQAQAELAEQQRIEEEKLAQEKLAQEKLAQEKLAQEKLAQEKLAQEKLEQEKLAQEKLAQEKLAQEKLAQEKLAQEKLAQEKLAQEKLEQEKLAQEKLAQEKLAQEKLAQEKLAQEKLAQEKLAQEKLEQEKLAQEKLAQEKLAQEKLEQEKLASEARNEHIQEASLLQVPNSSNVVSTSQVPPEPLVSIPDQLETIQPSPQPISQSKSTADSADLDSLVAENFNNPTTNLEPRMPLNANGFVSIGPSNAGIDFHFDASGESEPASSDPDLKMMRQSSLSDHRDETIEAAPTIPEAKDLIKKMEEISKTPVPTDWAADIVLPDVEEMKRERSSLTEAIKQAQTKIASLDNKIAQVESLKIALLGADNENLVNATLRVFSRLGWNANPSEKSSDEFYMNGGGNSDFVAKIVKSTAQAQRSDVSSLASSVVEFWDKTEVEPKGVLIACTWSGSHPSERTEPDFADGLVDFAQKKGLCLMTTIQLLAMYRDFELGKQTGDEMRKRIEETNGRLLGFQITASAAKV
jgi:hypothetical protein